MERASHPFAHIFAAEPVGLVQPGIEGGNIFLRVTGQLGPAAADLKYLAILRLHDHGDGRFPDPALEFLLALAERFLGRAPVGHVDEGDDDAVDLVVEGSVR